jgi:hypothetical protein
VCEKLKNREGTGTSASPLLPRNKDVPSLPRSELAQRRDSPAKSTERGAGPAGRGGGATSLVGAGRGGGKRGRGEHVSSGGGRGRGPERAEERGARRRLGGSTG